MTAPRVSVVLPVRNAATTVERAARSILDSTLREIELIVIDDGSADNSAKVVRQISDPRLRLVQQEPLGVCAAANRGAAEAAAPVIARMDADDFSHPARLEKQLSLLCDSGADMVGCQVRIVDALGQAVESMQRYELWSNSLIEPERIAAMRFVELPIVNPTLLARREVFELGFRYGAWPEDYDFCLRALGQGHTAAKVPEVLFDWIDSGDRLTRTDERYSPEAFDRCRRAHILDGPLAGKATVDLWGAGQAGKPWLRWLQAEGFTVRHIVEVSPKKIGTKIHDTPVIADTELPPPDGTPLIIAVGAIGARELIEAEITQKGYTPGKDAWFVC
ncbi:MAG: glycosyltransferase family 2 protein [Verrucomicrobiota bacterium]|nr:glycosyltransferase family 2 protein [Verrucomicrobiota bacterium]MDP7292645.1 glycosyltransferase family 2 protein [Verrucomicrobiota bacterium]HJN82161.1 glycosyltransferase family 2 protein [Verrucomicrobiota bacterium]